MNDKINLDRIIEAMGRTGESKIAVVGDFCLDKYLYVDSGRDEISVETGLTAFQVSHKKIYPGAGGTITNNLRALGAQVYCVGIAGDDGEGFELMRCLNETGANTDYMVRTALMCTGTYTKPMRMENGVWTEMNRFDFRNYQPVPCEVESEIIGRIDGVIGLVDAVLMCDQFLEADCGVLTARVRKHIEALVEEYPGKFFYADSRGFINEFHGVMVKCNNYEAVRCIQPEFEGVIRDEDIDLVKSCGMKLSDRNQKAVFITMGSKGSMVFDRGGAEQIDPVTVEGPIDICGAGDANNAGIVLGLTLGLDLCCAAMLGNIVSSITIRQIGVTGTATPEQVTMCAQSLKER